YYPGDMIFEEGSAAKYYYQIATGTVKINNYFEDGKEFVHGFPFDGHCFGESYLFTSNVYAVNAKAERDSDIYRLDAENFIRLLKERPELHFAVSAYTAERLHFRYIIASCLAISSPMIKVLKLMEHLKQYFKKEEQFELLIPFTRRQLASLLGLRVETVIREIKKLETQNRIKIVGNKLYF
ncbi:Crp/Fnr family transcriptional regulator, partial [uncultured Chryseobacterium sp.]|uniref:Crp/Fnr family transcriptional regulator n=1 Tax=uncultured Chryseobacterium sp. TaxID=259322 RepID=UPI0025841A11